MTKDIYILGIETSCDETAASVVKNGTEIISNVVASQITSQKRFGGVVPEIASRHHVEQITLVIEEALAKAELKPAELDAVAVTEGPGLVGALLIGVNAAKARGPECVPALVPGASDATAVSSVSSANPLYYARSKLSRRRYMKIPFRLAALVPAPLLILSSLSYAQTPTLYRQPAISKSSIASLTPATFGPYPGPVEMPGG